MITRYIFSVIFLILFIGALFLGNTPLKIPAFTTSNNQLKAANPLQNNPRPLPANSYTEPQQLSARSVTVIDAKTNLTLFEKNPNVKHLPASTTKLMTALVALEKCSPGEIITVAQVEEKGTQMGLKEGDQLTVKNLLYGLLINSGNDAAVTLASACATSTSRFVASMNEKAKGLDMINTHFINPTGFDDSLHYSTASDLAKLANIAISNPLISEIVTTKSTVVTDITGTKTYYLENINELLGVVDGIEGVKTGQTEGSLENLITRTSRNGNSVIVVVLGSDDRFGESQLLIEWAYTNINWVDPN